MRQRGRLKWVSSFALAAQTMPCELAQLRMDVWQKLVHGGLVALREFVQQDRKVIGSGVCISAGTDVLLQILICPIKITDTSFRPPLRYAERPTHMIGFGNRITIWFDLAKISGIRSST